MHANATVPEYCSKAAERVAQSPLKADQHAAGHADQRADSCCCMLHSRFLAAALPGAMALRFALAGLGITNEARLVAGTAVSSATQTTINNAGHTWLPRRTGFQPQLLIGVPAACLATCTQVGVSLSCVSLPLSCIPCNLPVTTDGVIPPDTFVLHQFYLQRTGRRQELLAGPMLYGLAHVGLTVAAWRSSPAAAAGLAALCAGDGAADLGGRCDTDAFTSRLQKDESRCSD
jgi:hypothetical protein